MGPPLSMASYTSSKGQKGERKVKAGLRSGRAVNIMPPVDVPVFGKRLQKRLRGLPPRTILFELVAFRGMVIKPGDDV